MYKLAVAIIFICSVQAAVFIGASTAHKQELEAEVLMLQKQELEQRAKDRQAQIEAAKVYASAKLKQIEQDQANYKANLKLLERLNQQVQLHTNTTTTQQETTNE